MEFDPETNTYTSHGPSARASETAEEVRQLKLQMRELKSRVKQLELDHAEVLRRLG